MNVNSFDDVVSLLSSSRHDGTSRYWWRVKESGEVLYGKFDIPSPSKDVRFRVLLYASQSLTRAAQITDDEISSIEWVDPMKPPFVAPSPIPRIASEELHMVKHLTRSVEIVQYNGMHYIHKYMNYLSQPSSFEYEILHHQRVCGTSFVPRLCNVVTSHGKNRGLLLEFIDGDNLSELSGIVDRSTLYSITATILEAITDLEMRGYYPQDLKCANVVMRHSDKSLFVVDLGDGFSEGMHLQESVQAFGKGSIVAKHMLYTLGRTIWELWIDDVPPDDETKEAPNTLPPLIRTIINDCCRGVRFKTISEAKEAYFEKLLAVRSNNHE